MQARTELDDAGLGPERVVLMCDLLERVRKLESEAAARDEAAAPLAEPDQAPGAAPTGEVRAQGLWTALCVSGLGAMCVVMDT